MNGVPDTGPVSVAQIEVMTTGEVEDSSNRISRRRELPELLHEDRSVISQVYGR